jgi:uncharacterized protein YdaU (DUF1376 family)
LYSYPHHIGDFIRDTARLSDSQCMAYLRLIWVYYQDEKPLSSDCKKLAFQIGACPEDTQLILEHFFDFDGNAYRHKRCDAEIEAYRERQKHGRNAAQKRWENARSMRGAYAEHAQSKENDANREPITDNRKPIKENTRRQAAIVCPEGISEQLWDDYKRTRKKPLTVTAWDGFQNEARKAGWPLEEALKECVLRGWQGFKAEWVQKDRKITQHQANQQATARALFGTSLPSKIIDMEEYDAKRITSTVG